LALRSKSRDAGSTRKPLFGRLDWMLAAGAGAFALSVLIDLPKGPEHWSSDWIAAYWSKRPETQGKDLALVYVSEQTLRDRPYLSPIDRRVLAQIIKKLDNAEPTSIGLDIILDRNTEQQKDDDLIKAIQETKSKITLGIVHETVLSSDDQSDRFRTQVADLCKTAPDSRITCGHVYLNASHSKFTDTLISSDDVIRLTPARDQRMSFGEAVACASGKYNCDRPFKSDYIAWLLPPKDGEDTFFTVDAAAIINETPVADAILKSLKGKIVLIGGNFKDKDQHFTPLSLKSHHRYPGLFIHAQYVSQIIESRTLDDLPVVLSSAFIGVLFAGGYYAGRRWPKGELWLQISGAIVLASLGLALYWFGLIFPFAYVIISWLVGVTVGHYGKTEREAVR
jgi:CHASE2 domain-containing sensor protein